MSTYCIQIRLQRTTTDNTIVLVPVTADVIIQNPDGTATINADRVLELATEIASSPTTEWFPEGCQIQPHPIQQPTP